MRYFFLALLVIFGVSFYFYEFEDEDVYSFDTHDRNSMKAYAPEGVAETARAESSKRDGSSDSFESLNPVDPDETFPGQGGFVYRSILDSNHEPGLIEQVKQDLDSFKRYGSIGKGKTTVEFESTQDLRESLDKKGIAALLQGLAFNPTNISNIAGPSFSMIGADDQGKLISGRGWNGFFQSYEDISTGRQLELSESQIEMLLGDETEVIEEFLNDRVGDVRASVQTMKDEQGRDVYSIQWNDADRSFTLNTRSFSKDDSRALATTILERYRLLPFKGWKTPYFLDPANPLHRMAIQRDQQRLNAKPAR